MSRFDISVVIYLFQKYNLEDIFATTLVQKVVLNILPSILIVEAVDVRKWWLSAFVL